MILPYFYPIFHNTLWIKILVPLGIKIVQLRIKNKSNFFIESEIQIAQQICKLYNTILVINDYWKLAIKYKCDFIHLGQEDLNYIDLNYIKKKNIKLGISTHNEYELERALLYNPDYIAFGPIYNTISKKMIYKPQGLNKLKKWRKYINNKPLVAIGGISLEKSNNVFYSGADSISVITDITLNSSPVTRVKKWLNIYK